MRKAPVLETGLVASRVVRSLGALSREQLLYLVPLPARLQQDASALVRSMAAYLHDSNLMLTGDPSPRSPLADAYVEVLQ